MIRYYFKLAIRNLWRYKQSTLFNLAGLSLGMTCCILLALYVSDDLGYDQYNHKVNRIFRLITEVCTNGSNQYTDHTPAPLKQVLKDEIPEMEQVVRFSGVQEYTRIEYQNKEFGNPKILLSDPEVFDMFDFKVIKGNGKSLLNDMHAIVITRSFAEKIFAGVDPLGKIITIKGDLNADFMVTGVVENLPQKSSIQFDCLVSFALLKEDRWGIWNFTTFISLKDHASPESIRPKLAAIENKYLNNKEFKTKLYLQAIAKVHLNLNPLNRFPTAIDNSPVFLFSLIGLFILLIACFNYIILSTTNASGRNIEIAVHKVHGATRMQLVFQYLGESVIIMVIASLIGVIVAENFIPVLNGITGKHLFIPYDDLAAYLLFLTGIIAVGILSGIYPALYLTSLKPSGLLRKEYYRYRKYKRYSFREILIVIQFFISIVLIISALIVQRQLRYIQNKNIGLDPENVIFIPVHSQEEKKKCAVFLENLYKNPGVSEAAVTSYMPGETGYCQSSWWEGLPYNEKSEMLDWISVDSGFIKVLNIKLLQGSNFSSEVSNQKSYILNRTACIMLGWNNPLGKKIDIIGPGEVIGVVEDFNFKTLHDPVKPVVLCQYPDIFEYIYVKIRPESKGSVMKDIQKEWTHLFPNQEFNYSFLQNQIMNTYQKEIKTARIIDYFTGIAIILSCFGIYSLVSYTTQRRTKEIGIRKVNGATTLEIMRMLSKDLFSWIVIAFVFATPVAYYFMHKWLQNFAYHTTLYWWIFVGSGIAVAMVAFVTVSWQSWRAACKNPVESLRYE